jgi:hypothetical protein
MLFDQRPHHLWIACVSVFRFKQRPHLADRWILHVYEQLARLHNIARGAALNAFLLDFGVVVELDNLGRALRVF